MPTVRELLTKVLFRVDNTSYTRAEKTIQKLKKSLETVGDSAKKGQAQTTATFTNIANAGRQAGNTIQKSMEAARVSIENVRGASIRASSALNTARAAGGKPIITRAGAPKAAKGGKTADYLGAGAAAAVAGAAITAPLANAVDDAAEFEYQMSKVQAVTQADAETMKKLSEQARALGRATEFNAKQAAEAQYYLGLAGWKQEAILAATPGLLNLAIAGGTDLARTADIISDDMTAMGIAVDAAGNNVRHFNDVFAATMSNSNTTIEMMGETMKYVGAVAGTLGMSIEDVAVVTGIMANNGTKAEQAGTSLRAFMTRLAKGGKPVVEALGMVNLTLDDLKDKSGEFKPLLQVVKQLREATKGLNKSDRAAFTANLVGMYGSTGISALLKETDENFAKMQYAIENADGATDRMAHTMQNNLRGSLIATKSAMYDFNVELGKSMTPALRDVNGALTGVLNGITGLAKEYPRLTTGMAVFAGIVGVGLVALGALGIAIGGIVTLAGAFGVTVGAPVVAAVLAIIGVIAAVIANLDTLKKKFPGLKDAASTALGTIKGMLDFLINPLETICNLLSRAKTGFDNLIAGAEQSARQRYATYTANYSNTFNLDSGDQIAPAVQASNGVSPW